MEEKNNPLFCKYYAWSFISSFTNFAKHSIQIKQYFLHFTKEEMESLNVIYFI